MKEFWLGSLFFAWAVLATPSIAEATVDFSKQRVEPWADRMFGDAVSQGRVAGLGVIAVQNGLVTFAKTYGYADAGLRKPIDPQVTRFRVASITKTFVATSIALLMDSGSITSLNDPANKYLKRVKLPMVGQRAITLLDLLTHRGGFEAWEENPDPAQMPFSPEDIRKGIPKIQAVLGDKSEYCNFCAAILGTVVEDISGELLQDFLAERVFRPLGMHGSLLNTSRNPSVDAGVAYAMDGPMPERWPYEFVTEFRAPAGSIDAPLMDMGKYMIAALGGEGSGILSRRSWESMFTIHARNAPQVSGFGMFWMIRNWNGTTVYEHGGALDGYNSMLSLFPGSNSGIFISCFCVMAHGGSSRAGAAYPLSGYNFSEMVYREFLGVPPVTAPVVTDVSAYVGIYEGDSHDSRWPRRIERLLSGVQGDGFMHVVSSNDNLMINGLGPFIPQGNHVFRDPSLNTSDPYVPYPNTDIIIFVPDTNGSIVSALRPLSVRTTHRLTLVNRPDFLRALALVSIGLCSVGFLVGRWKTQSESGRLVHRVGYWAALITLGSVALLVASFKLGWFSTGVGSGQQMAVMIELTVLATAIVLAAIVTSGVAIALWAGWGKASGAASLTTIIQVTAVAVGGLLLGGIVLLS